MCLLIRRATSQHNTKALLDVLPSTCTVFAEVIFEGDAAVPGLDLTAASPYTDVDGFGTGEDFAEGGDVDGLHSDWC